MIKGLGTALITPFDANGKVDYEALARLLDTQLTGFVDYLVVLGTTGEAATMTEKERAEVRTFIRQYVNGRIPLVLGVGGNCTAVVCESLKTIDLRGYEAILSVCPYYNKPNQEGLYQHFCAVAEASPIPVLLYNVPGRTGVNLLPETVMRIYEAQPDKILGIKEASGNIEQIKHLINLINAEGQKRSEGAIHLPLVISGDDGIACEIMKAGGAGLISVASNAFPEDFWHIVHDKDAALQAQYAEMVRLLFAEGNPVGIKAVLAQKGIIQNILRLPLVPASEGLQQAIRKEIQTQ
ncbi:MAG: 4-hydroxy-tetrahydrodipicolinate synthase [Bacteroidales bacterium]|nr:4-hydroxy-tetrahydrodipicolinate synthase [Bacteroidales bacterium]MDY6405509.1 4-hydroxy-tetrahydrodipicolinate synthase [Bacteroidales bacterium]